MAYLFVGDLDLTQSAPGRWTAEGRVLDGVVRGVVGGGLLAVVIGVGIVDVLSGSGLQQVLPFLIIGAVVGVILIVLMLRGPVRQLLEIDQRAGAVSVTQTPLLKGAPGAGDGRQTRAMRDVVLVMREATFNRRVISVGFSDGGRWVLSFKNAEAEVDALADFVRGEARRLREPSVSPEAGSAEPQAPEVATPDAGADRAVTDLLLQQVRSSAFWSIGLGLVQLFAPGLSRAWGVSLLLLGALAFLLPTPAMRIVNIVTFFWVAGGNALSGSPFWIGLAGIQIWDGILGFRRWRKAEQYRRSVEGALPVDTREAQARRFFPWLGLGLGIGAFVSVIVLVATFFGYVLLSRGQGDSAVFTFIGFLESLVVNLGVLGFAIGLASLLAGFDRKSAAAVGMVGGVAAIALDFGLGMWLNSLG